MNTLRVAFVATLLSASSAYADAAPHWTAAIVTGRASESLSNTAPAATPATPANPANPTGIGTSPHWTAFIGTGQATEANALSAAKASATGAPTTSAHWTS